MKRLAIVVAAAPLLLLLAGGSAAAAGKDLFEKKCTKCHSEAKTAAKRGSKDYWPPLVKRMQTKRTNFISDKEAEEVTAYLVASYGSK